MEWKQATGPVATYRIESHPVEAAGLPFWLFFSFRLFFVLIKFSENTVLLQHTHAPVDRCPESIYSKLYALQNGRLTKLPALFLYRSHIRHHVLRENAQRTQ